MPKALILLLEVKGRQQMGKSHTCGKLVLLYPVQYVNLDAQKKNKSNMLDQIVICMS